jgi:circadian clock protein KaiC
MSADGHTSRAPWSTVLAAPVAHRDGCSQRRTDIGTKSKVAEALPKLATGIEGFDELSRGGLPRNRTSLLIGGPGAGKTVFALQCLVNAVRRQRTPGIFVAFEESPRQVIANGATFDWGLTSLTSKELFFLDAHMSPTLVKAGDFDLAGMLAMLAAKKKEIGAQWIVFDGIDVLLTLLQDPVSELREIYRIRDWLADNALTAIVTAKIESRASEALHYGLMQFMADCVVRFARRQEVRVSQQSLQITKKRGSGDLSGEFPLRSPRRSCTRSRASGSPRASRAWTRCSAAACFAAAAR